MGSKSSGTSELADRARGAKSAWSVNDKEGNPSSAARRQVRSIDPAVASQDHSLWTWLSGGNKGACAVVRLL